jgi:hypothetical protein
MKTYDLFIITIIIEMAILSAVVVFLVIKRIYEVFHQKSLKRETTEINELILNKIQGENAEINIPFPKKIKYTEVLLDTLEDYNYRFKGGIWEEVKKEAVDRYLLDLARKRYKSPLWKNRLFSARCFAIRPQKEDIFMIKCLMDDSAFLVQAKAACAAAELEDPFLVEYLIEKASKAYGYARCFFKELIYKGTTSLFQFVEEVLMQTPGREVQLICLEILGSRLFPLQPHYLRKGITSFDEKIQLATLSLFARNPQKESLEVLLGQVHSPRKEARKEALFGLANYPSEKTISILQNALDDEEWIVRLEAAYSLEKMGGEYLKYLKTQAKSENKNRADAANYVLTFH